MKYYYMDQTNLRAATNSTAGVSNSVNFVIIRFFFFFSAPKVHIQCRNMALMY